MNYCKYIKTIFVVTAFFAVQSLAIAQQTMLIGSTSYSTYLKKSGQFTSSASMQEVYNPYSDTAFGLTLKFVIADKAFSYGKNMKTKNLATRYLGDLDPGYYYSNVRLTGSGKVSLARGTYRLCMLLIDDQRRILDGITFKKKFYASGGKYSIRKLINDTRLIENTDASKLRG